MLWSTPSSVASLVAHVGALRAGLVVVPANTAYSERELAHIVTDVAASAAVVDRPDQAEWVRRAATGPVVVTGPGLDLPDGDPGPLDAAGPDDPALICFTSGTTGVPKGAVLRHRNLLAATTSVTEAWRWTSEDRLVHCLPVFHAHGLAVGAYGTLLAGASAVLLPGFDPAAVVAAAGDHRATLFFGVPTMYHRLVGSGQLGRPGRPAPVRVRLGPPVPASSTPRCTAATGIVVLERYGMTETLMNVSNPYEGERRAGTVGFPLPGVEVRLADDGEILVRGPNVFDGYWHRPEATAEVFVAADDGGRAVVPHRRPGRGVRRLPGDPGPVQGADHLRRVQRLPQRGRGRAWPPTPGWPRWRSPGRRRTSGGRWSPRGSSPTAPAPSADELAEFTAAIAGPVQAAPAGPRGRARCPATPWARWSGASWAPEQPAA